MTYTTDNPYEPGTRDWKVRYWSNRLIDIDKDYAKPILKKLNDIPSEPPTTLELFRIRSVLEDYASIARLLAEEVATPEPQPKTLLRQLMDFIKNRK